LLFNIAQLLPRVSLELHQTSYGHTMIYNLKNNNNFIFNILLTDEVQNKNEKLLYNTNSSIETLPLLRFLREARLLFSRRSD